MDWDAVAERYDDLFLQDPVYREILRRMAEEVREGEDTRVLDLGCGTGNLISVLLQRHPSLIVVGVDPSQGMRRKCADRFSDFPGVTISEGEALDIPFPDSCFNFITSNLALHHVPPDLKAACAAELARVLVPGGSLIHADTFCGVKGSPGDPAWCRDIIEKHFAMALYDLDHGAYEMMFAYLSLLPKVLTQDGEYLITVDEWRVNLEAAGFTAFEVTDIPPIDLMKIVRCTRR